MGKRNRYHKGGQRIPPFIVPNRCVWSLFKYILPIITKITSACYLRCPNSNNSCWQFCMTKRCCWVCISSISNADEKTDGRQLSMQFACTLRNSAKFFVISINLCHRLKTEFVFYSDDKLLYEIDKVMWWIFSETTHHVLWSV